ncbi:MAG: hypothetical protein AB7V18_14610 [Pyrinomonadaceae bacterium]
MFCPNCGSKNGIEQNYCRGCGLKLDAIVEAVAGQFPSEAYAALQRRREIFRKLGVLSFSIAGFVGFSLILFKAAQYKAILFGEEVLIWSAIGAVVGFSLLSIFFFNYPRLFMKGTSGPAVKGRLADPVTADLIEDRPLDHVPTVTDNTTETLYAPRIRKGI